MSENSRNVEDCKCINKCGLFSIDLIECEIQEMLQIVTVYGKQYAEDLKQSVYSMKNSASKVIIIRQLIVLQSYMLINSLCYL